MTHDELELAEAVVAEAVAAGAEFMDAIDVNVTDDAELWFWVVNPETLDMVGLGDGTGRVGCITAQHHPTGRFDVSGYVGSGIFNDSGDPLRLAFNVGACADRIVQHAKGYPGARRLTALWREEIYDRRSAWFDTHPEAVISEGAA